MRNIDVIMVEEMQGLREIGQNFHLHSIHIIICFCNAQLCTNDYFIPNFFPMRLCKMGICSCFLASFARINR